jgi:hypothetical protein
MYIVICMYIVIRVRTLLYWFVHCYTGKYIVIPVRTLLYWYVHCYTDMYIVLLVRTLLYWYVHCYNGIYIFILVCEPRRNEILFYTDSVYHTILANHEGMWGIRGILPPVKNFIYPAERS